MTPAETERAAVVAWLLSVGANLTAQGRRALEMAADNIAQGAHRGEHLINEGK